MARKVKVYVLDYTKQTVSDLTEDIHSRASSHKRTNIFGTRKY